MMTKEERKNVNEELVALLLSFPEKQAAAILRQYRTEKSAKNRRV